MSFSELILALSRFGWTRPFNPQVGDAWGIYRWAGYVGHAAQPIGPFYTLLWKELDDVVPLAEVQAMLRHLGIPEAAFWDFFSPPQKGLAASAGAKI